ncbi:MULTISPECIES: hypothetical protein [Paenibacillus]|uniref:DUF4825 domain-containing protein n=1 Tax=Paenibacillus vandeheii TaxID=3035917 RepID=A0ABT8JIE9_9BACL|nr:MULTISPECIES: hypothetical protein [Paenibacillus]OXS57142.1 hypothetical protein B1B00_15785 [Bacillus sp. DSM 27956]PRX73898.1 hypothetical protein B0G93_11816 [Bacillus sp. V-88]KGP81371.1 hypothetical protein P363_0128175 [Paenibacillus sp. MAEPY1]KGP82007.1 hypothetical protein P364_0114430 [Paenibacillus sp. MAEPY2]MDN4603929.1 hypothetical protein [Paenibacillus vandeheii]
MKLMKLNRKNILIIIVSIFALWNLSWFLITSIKYHKFVEVVPKNEFGVHLLKKDDGYIYSIKKPGYLSFTGNLAISNDDDQESLIIWPLITGGYEYGFSIQKDRETYEFYVDDDDNMKPIDENDPAAIEKMEEYKLELEELLSKAKEMWQL